MAISTGGALGGAATGAGIGSIVPGIGTALGAGIGGFLGLFSGKKKPTDYTSMQTPQQKMFMRQLLAMIGGRMGQPSAGMQPTNDAMNMLYSQFFKRPFNPQQRPMGGMPGPMGGMPGPQMGQNAGGQPWQV